MRNTAQPSLIFWLGVIPFVVARLAMLVALRFLPGLAIWLPHRLYGS